MVARAIAPGTEEVLEDRYLFGEDDRKGQTKVKTNVVVRRIASDEATDPFLILATWGVAPDTATALYRRRGEIETLFAALKSRGFKLEKTHLTIPMQKFLHRSSGSWACWHWPSPGPISLARSERSARGSRPRRRTVALSAACSGMPWTGCRAF
jgi:hypothetical protein